MFKNGSSFGTLASVLFWPYILFVALVTLDSIFMEAHWIAHLISFASYLRYFCFRCWIISYHPKFGHWLALLAGAWSYGCTGSNSEARNWKIHGSCSMFRTKKLECMTTFTPTLQFSLSPDPGSHDNCCLRLLPARWRFRKLSLVIGPGRFCLSVMFFHSGSVNRSCLTYSWRSRLDYPILGILHVEKRGLQFHETSITYSGTIPSMFRGTTVVSSDITSSNWTRG